MPDLPGEGTVSVASNKTIAGVTPVGATGRIALIGVRAQGRDGPNSATGPAVILPCLHPSRSPSTSDWLPWK